MCPLPPVPTPIAVWLRDNWPNVPGVYKPERGFRGVGLADASAALAGSH